MWAKIVQHRLVFLLGVLAVAVGGAALEQSDDRHVADTGLGVLGVLDLALLVAVFAAANARRPMAFLVRAGAFTTPPDSPDVLTGAMMTVNSLLMIGSTAFNAGGPLSRLSFALSLLVVLLLAVVWTRLLGPFGPSLRPDGLADRQPFGSLFVPWEAGPSAEPTTIGVKLRFARPDLVQRRGLRRSSGVRFGADRGFAAWAVNLYSSRPELRPTIGTDEGLQRITPRPYSSTESM
ncbi:hypothetical protein [Actinoplanes sp. NPDC020271]|uniref:hypothetical protein n=1 Tax=Actinoplanes sp. NPDC020271 TaxID=3363896 RepID=UPI00378B6DDC